MTRAETAVRVFLLPKHITRFDRMPEKVLFFFGENENVQTIFFTKNDSLISAFEIPKGVTALVGGGGKTTLMLRLARELAQTGARVIVTTTTHIFPPEGIATTNPATLEEARAALARESLACFGQPAEDGKLSTPEISISEMERVADYVLVEADGAKRLPLKATAEHEPVIPNETRLVIAVAGLDGAGKAMHETVFRPARYAALCGKLEEDLVTPREIALVLAHAEGQRKSVPPGARFAVLLNKADDEARRKIALEIASVLGQYSIERVVIASLNG